jgi:hypothetical protein
MADLISDRLEAPSRVSEPLSQQPRQERDSSSRRRPQPRPAAPEAEPEVSGELEEDGPPHKVDSLA